MISADADRRRNTRFYSGPATITSHRLALGRRQIEDAVEKDGS